ncbi:hypothetical protein AGMMS50276_32080 [Synergistales bacterium]|nr:hypothetical protein AGMMS50276_32080 [Synergistales bacterium]
MVRIKKLRLYLETTVFNYYFDTDRDGHADTVRLFEAIGAGEYEGYTSEYVMLELRNASEPKRNKMLALVENYGIKSVYDDAMIVRLSEIYIQSKIIPVNYRTDSAHIAAASVYGLDCVVSYNFQHINRARTKILTAQVNREEGYNSIVICTSKEVLDDGI